MLSALLFCLGTATAVDTIRPAPGQVITRSTVLVGEVMAVPPPGDSVVVRVRGNDLVVDLSGAVLRGSAPSAAPDRRTGIALLVEGGRNITIRGARMHGYRIAILARGVSNLVIDGGDLSDNWAPRLWSGLGHESLVDWLYYHKNERDEWLRYGAALYLADVDSGQVRGVTAHGGQNGLLLVRSRGVTVVNTDFSFLSGLGIGLYRSSGNVLMHNRLDWCVRGVVPGVYRRGQDSAALLLYEQSSGNVIAYNSMTHGGDGLFLWAGQSTMDSGAGGSNDNLVFGNDVSWAVTNGLEATFSRNRFIGNRIVGGNHGIWGGYSWESEVRANDFGQNAIGIAIEHGQDNRILDNRFDGDRTAVRLWWNRVEPGDWVYPKRRDTRSRDYRIEGNTFVSNRVALQVENTQRVRLDGNRAWGVDTLLAARGDTAGTMGAPPARLPVRPSDRPSWHPDLADPAARAPLPGGQWPWLQQGTPQGIETMVVDEWGPYDWRYPRLWPASVADSAWTGGPLALRVIGPAGRWRIVGSQGVAGVSATSGMVGDTITVTPAPGPVADPRIEFEFVGAAVRAPGGQEVPRGTPWRFTWRRFVAPVAWTVRVAAWDSASDPRAGPEPMRARLAAAIPLEAQPRRLDWMWYRPRIAGVPAERFALSAEGDVVLPEGEFDLVAISDDGIRVWVDDRLAIDNWQAHESVVDRAPITPGRHRLRVEYYQVDGWVELRVEVRPREG